MPINNHLSVNELQASMKRQVSQMDQKKKKDLSVHCTQETHFRPERPIHVKMKGWNKYSMQVEMKRNLGEQYSQLIKQTLNQSL